MRTLEEIMADPEATAFELEAIIQPHLDGTTGEDLRVKCAVISHVNCLPELWWALFQTRPLEAFASPAFPLMVLEAPNRLEETVCNYSGTWVLYMPRQLLFYERNLFYIDCLSHTLEIFAKHKTIGKEGIALLRDCLKIRKRYANREISEQQAKDQSFYYTLHVSQRRRGSSYFVQAFWNFGDLKLYEEQDIPDKCQAAEAYRAYTSDKPGWDEVYTQATVWQWYRLLDYFQGRAP